MADGAEWVPDVCTLPTAEQPLRVAEFQALFTHALQAERRSPTLLELRFPGSVEGTARELARRESGCCSFFVFEFESGGDDLVMRIGVPQTRIEVLDALQTHVRA